MEYFDPVNRPEQIEGVRAAVSAKLNTTSGAFAVLNVGEATNACKETLDLLIQIAVIGSGDDLSHTGIFGYERNNTAAAMLLSGLISPSDIFSSRS